MIKTLEIKLRPAEISDEVLIKQRVAQQLRQPEQEIDAVQVLRRSIDARSRHPFFRVQVAAYLGEAYQPEPAILAQFQSVEEAAPVIIVGAGPAGMFAALELIELGLKPILLERGKDVRARRRDLRAIQQFGQVDPHSNYCFGGYCCRTRILSKGT